jgi:hypothetical protein
MSSWWMEHADRPRLLCEGKRVMCAPSGLQGRIHASQTAEGGSCSVLELCQQDVTS